MELVIQELVLSIPEPENPGFANHRLQDTGPLIYLHELQPFVYRMDSERVG